MAMSTSAVSILGGTGQQGSGLARRLAAAGLAVTIGSRDPERARQAIAHWATPADAFGRPITVTDNGAAVADTDLVIVAVPFVSVDALIDDLRPRLRAGTVVIDVTVPVTFVGGRMAMIDVAEGSASEHIRAR